jgi:hypothetical protein
MSIIKRVVFVVCLLLTGLCAKAQTHSCDSIVWRAGRKLTWNDFKGTLNLNDPVSARSNTNFVREWAVENGTLKTTMICFFSPCLSWSKSKRSARLLKHEQGHFDITEYYRRVYYKRIAEASYTPATLPALMKDIYDSITRECGTMQEAYDRETHHSLLTDKQREWQLNITQLLAAERAYNRKTMVVTLPRELVD